MDIVKSYHFYAAHRNYAIDDKCRNLHGHTYFAEITLCFPQKNEAGVTMLFSDIDKLIEPIVKHLDHTTLLHSEDELCDLFDNFNCSHHMRVEYVHFPFHTSAENIAKYLFEAVLAASLPVVEVKLRETCSSVVVYRGE